MLTPRRVARVKKIINVDPDIGNCSNNAAFVITVATEMFLQHLVEQSFNQVKSEHTQKPRRNIQYRDVGQYIIITQQLTWSTDINAANAVARVENLEFLSDVVPRTMTMKAFKEKNSKQSSAVTNGLGHGQNTLDRHLGGQQNSNGAGHGDNDDDEEEEQDESEDDDAMHTDTVEAAVSEGAPESEEMNNA